MYEEKPTVSDCVGEAGKLMHMNPGIGPQEPKTVITDIMGSGGGPIAPDVDITGVTTQWGVTLGLEKAVPLSGIL